MQETTGVDAGRPVAGALRGRIGVILNPNARKNRRRPGRTARLGAIVGDHGVVRETASLADLRAVLRELVVGGASYLVSDGGDGALNWMYNELEALRAEELPHLRVPPLVPTRSGTIDFVATKVGIGGNAEQIVERLVRRVAAGDPPEVLSLESLVLEGVEVLSDGRQRPFRRVGFAAAVGGIGQRFFGKYYQLVDPGPASILRVVAAAVGSQAVSAVPLPVPHAWRSYAQELFAPTSARVTIDGRAVPATAHGAIHAGAFDVNLGGVFRVFPLARDAGSLHLQAGAIGPWAIVRNLPRLYRGKTIRSESLWERQGTEMRVEATGTELLAPVVDGEIFTNLAEVTVRPGPRIPIAKV